MTAGFDDERREGAGVPGAPGGAGAFGDASPFGGAGAFGGAGGAVMSGDGLSWCWDLDMPALLAALSDPVPWQRAAGMGNPAGPLADRPLADSPARAGSGCSAVDPGAVDPEAEEEEYQAAVAAGQVSEVPLDVVAGRVAESLPVGPGLAGWLAQARAGDLEDGALAGVAASFRRLASWAAAGELAAVAQIASRSARSDRHAEVDSRGCPDRITADATGQVALALAISQDGASGLIDLAVALTWRLPATAAALAAGEIDLSRARMIARMTSSLSEQASRLVEAAVLGRAGWQTLGQLHAALRRAVIKADPDGAERRREEAERRAKVALYSEDEGTATLAGYSLPGIHAAAAMARITALAKAMRAAGASGGIDLVRAQVFLGLLLGTLPYIPPPPGAPADGDAGPGGGGPGEGTGAGGGTGERAGAGGGLAGDAGGAGAGGGLASAGDPGDAWPDIPPAISPGPTAGTSIQPVGGGLLDLVVPFDTLTGAAAAPGQLSRLGVITADQARRLAALAARHPATRWRIVVTTPAGQAIAVGYLPRDRLPRDRAGPALLAGDRGSPGSLGDSLGSSLGDSLHGGLGGGAKPGDSAMSNGVGLTRQVTLVIGAGVPGGRIPGVEPRLAMILRRAREVAIRMAGQAAERSQEDARVGGCAHDLASVAYRPPPRIAELVRVRDGTCRFGTCRRPAEQCDLDHTIPFEQGGLTCSCNLGGQCRSHHQLKQHPRWTLAQPAPGVFQWTTPAGRTYTVHPDPFMVS